MKGTKVLKVSWAIAFFLGLIGVYQRLLYDHQPAAYGSYVVWGLWVATYIYLIGLSAGAFLLSSLVYVFNVKRLEKIGKLSLLTALATLMAALLVIWFDIGHMDRFWKVYTNFAWRSMMAWMVWLYTAYFLLLLVEFWFALWPDLVAWTGRRGFAGTFACLLTFGQRDLSPEALERDQKVLRILGTLGVPLAIAFHRGVGALFGVVGARLYWHATIYPLIFLASALASGSALLTFLTAFFGPGKGTKEHRELVRFLATITLGLLLMDALFEWAEFSISLYVSIPAAVQGFLLVIFGPYWWVFWLVHVLLGIVVPLLMLTMNRRNPVWVGLAAFLITFTFIAVRLNIVIPGLAYPELKGLETAFVDHRLTFLYFPSLMGWMVSLFVMSVGTLLFYLGYVYLPVVESQGIKEV